MTSLSEKGKMYLTKLSNALQMKIIQLRRKQKLLKRFTIHLLFYL